MTRISLTDLTVKKLPLPETGQARYWDASLSGFGLRVSQGGAKTWILLDPRSKTRTQETIGRYPLIGLADARTEAKRMLAERTLGGHKSKTAPWNKARDEFLGGIEKTRKPRTHVDYKRILTTRFPFGETRLSDLTPQDIRKKLDKLDYAPAEQQHAFVVVRAFLNWAHQKHYLDQQPMARMKPPHAYKPRERILSDEELKAVWNACGDDAHGTIVKLLMLTGQRVGEITKLSRDMVEDDRITLPSWLAKNSRQHTFPIGPTAQSILKPLVEAASEHESKFLFPARGKIDRYFSGFSKAKSKLDEASGVSNWTLHDLRRTNASGLASLGVSLPVVEKLLNHISGSFAGIVGVYQRYDFFPEMQDAMTKWEAHLLSITET